MLKVKTPTVAAMACLTLLVGLEPAIAQPTYSLSISRHPSVQLTEDKVDRILADASRMLQKKSGYKDRPDNVACNVTLKRDGAVHTFASSNTPAVITNESERDAVHKENFEPNLVNLHVVKKIEFCRPGLGNSFRGCSWPHYFQSIIVAVDRPVPHLVWPHEFGHLTGLWHRQDQLPRALMSPCPLTNNNVQVTRDECDCFLSGPGTCKPPEPQPPAQCTR